MIIFFPPCCWRWILSVSRFLLWFRRKRPYFLCPCSILERRFSSKAFFGFGATNAWNVCRYWGGMGTGHQSPCQSGPPDFLGWTWPHCRHRIVTVHETCSFYGWTTSWRTPLWRRGFGDWSVGFQMVGHNIICAVHWFGLVHPMSALVAGRQRSGTQPSLLEGCLSTPWVSFFFLVFLLLPRKMSPVLLNTHIGNWFIPFVGSSLPLVRSQQSDLAHIGYGYMSRSRCFLLFGTERNVKRPKDFQSQTRPDWIQANCKITDKIALEQTTVHEQVRETLSKRNFQEHHSVLFYIMGRYYILYFFQIEAGPSPYVAGSVSNRSNW